MKTLYDFVWHQKNLKKIKLIFYKLFWYIHMLKEFNKIGKN